MKLITTVLYYQYHFSFFQSLYNFFYLLLFRFQINIFLVFRKYISMGNELCCQDTSPQPSLQPIPQRPSIQQSEEKQSSIIHKPPSVVTVPVPSVTRGIQDYLDSQKPFISQLDNNAPVTRFGNDIYHGPLDENGKPHGFGKMYKGNQSLFVGKFDHGVANGPAHYIFPDGSYYAGQMVNNTAQTNKGIYVRQNPYLQYRGGFQNNTFHGQGIQKGNKHQFEGTYKQGKKQKGKLRWDTVSGNSRGFQYQYQGPFDADGKFHGKGKLKEIKGTYEGDFNHGEKHGFGKYFYEYGWRYEGQYSNGNKHGQGIIYSDANNKSYQGSWQNGLPNGKGYVFNESGMQKSFTELKDGIDVRLL